MCAFMSNAFCKSHIFSLYVMLLHEEQMQQLLVVYFNVLSISVLSVCRK